jgi:hypothetical protein
MSPNVFLCAALCHVQLLQCAWLILTGGFAALKTTLTFLSPMPNRVATKGMKEGAFGYYILVAEKPH